MIVHEFETNDYGQIELKLGTFMTPPMPGQQPRRINMPTLSEMS